MMFHMKQHWHMTLKQFKNVAPQQFLTLCTTKMMTLLRSHSLAMCRPKTQWNQTKHTRSSWLARHENQEASKRLISDEGSEGSHLYAVTDKYEN
mmetsp:Transcript_19723/g.36535  ORF Transcript_19723/g.36535 Transcript_19723/m.36535 type:complete len:94 (-) Transcript_19723:177-458(-)